MSIWDKENCPETPKNWDDGTWQEVWTNGTGSERVRHEPWCDIDYHVDLGCGTIKKGRIGVDWYPSGQVDVIMDLNRVGQIDALRHPADPKSSNTRLPFDDSSIESIITHHCLEHIGDGFIPLIDEVYRVLQPDGIFYAITPLFPARNAVDDPTHCRYMTEETWRSFCGHLGDENNPTGCWLDAFSVPYTKARFEMVEQHADPLSAPEKRWGPDDVREIRVVLKARK